MRQIKWLDKLAASRRAAAQALNGTDEDKWGIVARRCKQEVGDSSLSVKSALHCFVPW
jgi:hypothetical protein